MLLHATRAPKQAGIAILISDKVDFKTDQKRHKKVTAYYQGNSSTGGDYNCKSTCTKCWHAQLHTQKSLDIKRTDEQQYKHSGGLRYLTLTNRQVNHIKNINKNISELQHAIEQMDLIAIYKMFHPTTAEFTFFSAAHRTFFKLGHILGHKVHLSKYKRIQ